MMVNVEKRLQIISNAHWKLYPKATRFKHPATFLFNFDSGIPFSLCRCKEVRSKSTVLPCLATFDPKRWSYQSVMSEYPSEEKPVLACCVPSPMKREKQNCCAATHDIAPQCASFKGMKRLDGGAFLMGTDSDQQWQTDGE